VPTNSGTATSTPPNETGPPESSGTVKRFIEGEPMKVATKVFAGCS
jgi:hypothetical protein